MPVCSQEHEFGQNVGRPQSGHAVEVPGTPAGKMHKIAKHTRDPNLRDLGPSAPRAHPRNDMRTQRKWQ